MQGSGWKIVRNEFREVLLLCVVLSCCGAADAGSPKPPLSIFICCRQRAQQQTHRNGVRQANDGTEARQTDGRPTIS